MVRCRSLYSCLQDTDGPPRKKKKKGGKQRNVIPDPVTIDITELDTSTLETNGKRLRIFRYVVNLPVLRWKCEKCDE